MRLLEYQAKELFKEYNINTPDSISSTDIEKGRQDAKKIGYPFVIRHKFLLADVEKLVEFKNAIMKMSLS